jgi:hypothetical protein
MPPVNVIATLAVDDTDPPTATIAVSANGEVLTPATEIPPEAILGLGQAVGQATGDPSVEAALRRLLTPVVEALRRAVDEGAAQQHAREQALAAWEPVLPPQ